MFLEGSIQLFISVVKSDHNVAIDSEWAIAISWILWVAFFFLSDLAMGFSEVESNNTPQLSCKMHFIAAQLKGWELSILLNIAFRTFTLF